MPYQDTDEGHRISIVGVLPHCKQIFDQGLQLEAILLAHEYLEQRLNSYYKLAEDSQLPHVHHKFKNIIDLLHAIPRGPLSEEDYAVLNEFNRLRNINSHKILDESLELRGAKKGDMMKAMDLAERCDAIITSVLSDYDDDDDDDYDERKNGNKGHSHDESKNVKKRKYQRMS